MDGQHKAGRHGDGPDRRLNQAKGPGNRIADDHLADGIDHRDSGVDQHDDADHYELFIEQGSRQAAEGPDARPDAEGYQQEIKDPVCAVSAEDTLQQDEKQGEGGGRNAVRRSSSEEEGKGEGGQHAAGDVGKAALVQGADGVNFCSEFPDRHRIGTAAAGKIIQGFCSPLLNLFKQDIPIRNNPIMNTICYNFTN